MEQVVDAPSGESEVRAPQHKKGVSSARQPSGWRKPTPGLGVAEQLARDGERLGISKTRAFVAVKRVGAHIGLKPGDMMLLDTLGAFTQTQDWEEGARPIVWASNAYLMEQTGFSLSALKRHTRRLAELGVISFRDSPNGKRWGRRDTEGRIIEAYGFDLSPLSARAEAFEALYVDLHAERTLCQRLKRQITIARRAIRARIEAAFNGALRGPWVQFAGLFDALLGRLPGRNDGSDQLAQLLSGFDDLREKVDAAYFEATKMDGAVEKEREIKAMPEKFADKMTPREVTIDPHILSTNQLKSVIRKSSKNGEHAAGAVNARPEDQIEPELEAWVAKAHKAQAALDLSTVLQACPEFASWARNVSGFLKDWRDLHRAAGQLRPMIGVSEHAWNVAQDRLGKQVATAALALVFEKHCAGEVSSPGGFLRGMVEKAGAGELHLERSFYGRLSGQGAKMGLT
ncbi:plasmid replication protein RepC [Arenibacterium halophilum]|uniref:Replication protein C n=1 Tax=Arenibacterium halophilum TaxID=2583821 RepID=A0ABY2WX90_9RHOB|nr:plasmid replication protein RepC [Arenibacterium halophilum]TMV07456.1 replication protein C [Arenibacterium halophilum]